jgi:hypothetical protein
MIRKGKANRLKIKLFYDERYTRWVESNIALLPYASTAYNAFVILSSNRDVV